MTDLLTWLRAQLDEDERKVAAMQREARRVQTAPIFQDHPPNWLASVDIFVSPKRWQDEIDAKRRIIEAFEQRETESQHPDGAVFGYHATGLLLAIRHLAAAYADRPGYREEWRP